MPDYFSHFPKIYYDAVGNGNPKLVTNLLRRVQMKAGLIEIAAVFIDGVTVFTEAVRNCIYRGCSPRCSCIFRNF